MQISVDTRRRDGAGINSQADSAATQAKGLDTSLKSNLKDISAAAPERDVTGLNIHEAASLRATEATRALRAMYPDAPPELIAKMRDFINYASTAVDGFAGKQEKDRKDASHSPESQKDPLLMKEEQKIQMEQREKEKAALAVWIKSNLQQIHDQYYAQAVPNHIPQKEPIKQPQQSALAEGQVLASPSYTQVSLDRNTQIDPFVQERQSLLQDEQVLEPLSIEIRQEVAQETQRESRARAGNWSLKV